MSFAVLFAPLVLILPSAGQSLEDSGQPSAHLEDRSSDRPTDDTMAEAMSLSYRVSGACQVRIEQQTTIRVAPRPNMSVERLRAPRIVERRIGRCLRLDGLAGVQVETGNRVLLYLRDRRVVRAELERSCRARDFYSGFYVAASEDGKVCVGRDILLSRSGANCKLTRIRQLVPE